MDAIHFLESFIAQKDYRRIYFGEIVAVAGKGVKREE